MAATQNNSPTKQHKSEADGAVRRRGVAKTAARGVTHSGATVRAEAGGNELPSAPWRGGALTAEAGRLGSALLRAWVHCGPTAGLRPSAQPPERVGGAL